MENKTAGMLLIGIAALIGFVVWSFNQALTEIVNSSCSHGPSCPMWGTINFQTNIGIGLIVFVVAVGAYLIFFTGKAAAKKAVAVASAGLSSEDKSVLVKISEADGSIFQSDLVEKTGLTKVKVSRILDRLEGKGIIERKRRGMTNVVILKGN
jgi:uncharacterized membrane protein